MTNGDKIRSMTDEELVDNGLVECPKIIKNCNTGKSCFDCKVEYLQREADDQ